MKYSIVEDIIKAAKYHYGNSNDNFYVDAAILYHHGTIDSWDGKPLAVFETLAWIRNNIPEDIFGSYRIYDEMVSRMHLEYTLADSDEEIVMVYWTIKMLLASMLHIIRHTSKEKLETLGIFLDMEDNDPELELAIKVVRARMEA